MNAPRLLLCASCHAGSVMRLLLLMGILLGGAAKPASANESPVACITSVTPPSPRAGQNVTVSGSCSDDDDGFLTRYEWTFSDGLFSKTSNQASVTRTVDAPGVYTVMLRVKDNDGTWSIRIKRKFTVTAATFTVNVLPSVGCAVTAGDGGVDVVEAPNGIVCSGGMAANDPLCAEQFKNSDIAALKVVPDTGYVFTGWTVNGAEIKTASADTLFLTTMPTLAGLSDILPPGTMLATVEIGCERPTVTAIQLKRGDGWETTPVAALQSLCQGATLTFRAVVKPTGGCTVVWTDSEGTAVGTGEILTHSFPASHAIAARCQDAPASEKRSVLATVLDNSLLSEDSIAVQGGYPPSVSLDECVFGQVWQEDVNLDFSACLDNGIWKPILTEVTGYYSRQTHVENSKEVEGTFPQETTFCAQVSNLNNVPPSCYGWVMEKAILAHEYEHEKDQESALQSAVNIRCETEVEALGASDELGISQTQAHSNIRNGDVYNSVYNRCLDKWRNIAGEMGNEAHTCRTKRAERNVVNPKIEAICETAFSNWPIAWNACPVCKFGPLSIPSCP